MTLHWWQHWFWITGRAPVVGALLCLLLADCDVRGQQQSPRAAPVPLALWPAAGERRLLGFAGPTAADDDGVPSPSPSPEVSPSAVTYLTTGGPGASAREPKAIGVLPAVLRTIPPASHAPRTATSVLEVVEELTSPSPPAPSAASSTTTAETGAEQDEVASAAEMSNDEPARASEASSTTTESPAVAEDASPSPTARQPVRSMSLTSAPATAAAASPAPAGPSQASPPDSRRTASLGVSNLLPTTTVSSSSLASSSYSPTLASSSTSYTTTSTTSGSSSVPIVVHPGVSVPSRPTIAAPTSASAAPTVFPTTMEPPSVMRSAPATLGVSSASASSGKPGPGAMSLSAGGGLDAGSITGIVLGIVVFVGLIGTVSFVLYRRRYINKPQTLNDKCSNPDSSGYIDDSTLRENSEEMYSLDNDSFLNSLEAMTIQNYWTDTVKHTKL